MEIHKLLNKLTYRKLPSKNIILNNLKIRIVYLFQKQVELSIFKAEGQSDRLKLYRKTTSQTNRRQKSRQIFYKNQLQKNRKSPVMGHLQYHKKSRSHQTPLNTPLDV